jgi:hypothetical protein
MQMTPKAAATTYKDIEKRKKLEIGGERSVVSHADNHIIAHSHTRNAVILVPAPSFVGAYIAHRLSPSVSAPSPHARMYHPSELS